LNEEDKKNILNAVGISKFNRQSGESIDWARWSWNPISGCNHGCEYCYANDVAQRFYEQKFEPSIWPHRFSMPKNTKLSKKKNDDVDNSKNKSDAEKVVKGKRNNNVFTVSMGDLFGEWVPKEWIAHTLKTIKDNPQWNFILLTKNPNRLKEFVFPNNTWIGATVDCQDRVELTQKAFTQFKATVKFISCEPFTDYLQFTDMGMFDWVIIGGRSKNRNLPAFKPSLLSLSRFRKQVKKYDCKLYEKSNVLLKEYP